MPLDDEYVAPAPPPMYHYTVPLIGTGAGGDPFRPDAPAGTSFNCIGQPLNGELLIVTSAELPTKTGRKQQLPRLALEKAGHARGIPYDLVLSGWWVSG